MVGSGRSYASPRSRRSSTQLPSSICIESDIGQQQLPRTVLSVARSPVPFLNREEIAMRQHLLGSTIAAILALSPALAVDASASDPSVQLGPRPYYLVDKMSPSPLKTKLEVR